MNIKLFDEVWFDCYSEFINNIIYSLDDNDTGRVYCNNYVYIKPMEKNIFAKHFKSINTGMYQPKRVEELLFESVEQKQILDGNELFQYICDNLNANKLVMVSVDMYDYLPSFPYIYHINHVSHSAHIIGYDETSELFTVIERKIETIPKQKLVKACIAGAGTVNIYTLKDSIVIPPITIEEVKENARAIQKSINDLLDHFDIWTIHNPSKKDIDYFVAIPCCTHMESIQWRNHANSKLMSYITHDNKIGKCFENIEQDVVSLQKRMMYDCIRYTWENIEDFKEEVRQMLLSEKKAWDMVSDM